MNWEAIGAIGEIVGAFAVVLTLAYLAIQIRQNSNLAKATIREHRTDSSQKVIFAVSDIADLIVKRQEGAELSSAETLKINLIFRAMYRDWEGYAYQKHTGLLDDSEWKAIQETWRDVLTNEIARESWNQYKQQYSEILQRYVDELDS